MHISFLKSGRGWVCLCSLWIGACEKQESPPPPKPAAAPTSQSGTESKPAPNPAPSAPAESKPAPAGTAPAPTTATPDAKGTPLALEGITLTIPSEWPSETVPPSPMAPKAIFRLPKVAGDAEDGSIRVTHFPTTKGKDDMNIDRWLGQVRKADGQPAKREDAKISIKELGAIRVTLFDITGTVSGSMDGSGAGATNQRMINAIIDHPMGPHFLRATGGANTIARWQSAIETCALTAAIRN